MEVLRQKFHFTDTQCKQITDNAYKIINDAVQKVLKDVVPIVTENIAKNIVTAIEQARNNELILAEDTIIEDYSADKFMNDNFDHITTELVARNSAYTNYVSCVGLIDLYESYLSETPVYVPRKFRDDNKFCMTPQEREAVHKLETQKLRTEKEIQQLRRDEFKRRLDKGDICVMLFFRDKTPKSWGPPFGTHFSWVLNDGPRFF